MPDQSSKPPTHYIPAFTTTRSGLQSAACGAFIFDREHSSEPTCPRCVGWIAREAEDEAALFARMGYVPNGFGVMVPGAKGKGGPF
jgi:hypothetical protein